jgi:hypothetical protein
MEFPLYWESGIYMGIMGILVGTRDGRTQSARAQSARARIYIVLMGTTQKPKTSVLTF